MNKTFAAVTAALLLATPAVSMAADAPAISANLSLTSKYKYRGQDQSDPSKAWLPAVQGGFDVAIGGFYLGNWNSSIGFGGGTEMDFYGGYKGEVAGFGYDAGALAYYYPQGAGATSLNTTELYGSVGYGPVSVKYSHAVTKYFGLLDSKGTGYLEANINYPIGGGVTLNGHVGLTRLPGDARASNGLVNYTDYKIGATYEIGSGFSVAGAYVGADKKNVWGDVNKGRVVVTLTKAM